MHKIWMIVLLAALLISACSPAAETPTLAATAEDEFSQTEPTRAQPTTAPVNGAAMECQVVSLSPTPGPTEISMFPAISAEDWVLGDREGTPVMTIIEYSDFQCPYCAELAPILEQLQQTYPEDVLVAFRHFPLPTHPLAVPAAAAADAAGLQGKFWEMHDLLFASQQEFTGFTEGQFREWVTGKAADLELDVDQFTADMTSTAIVDDVQAAQEHGISIGIPGTPLLLLNGTPYQGPRDFENLEAILNLFKLEERQFTECPPTVIDTGKQYTATLKTEKGDIVIQLFADKAPLAVNSFVYLAQQGWFDNVTFHRVLPGFVAQAGDPSATGMGGPGYFFRNETNDLKYDKPGMVGMANSGADSNGSQFFITFQAVSSLDGGYTIFGEVIEGMDVAEQLAPRDPQTQMGLPPGDKILSVEIREQ